MQFSPIPCFLAVGRKRPPLCRGCAPATPPSKTIPRHRHSLFPTQSSTHRISPQSPPSNPVHTQITAHHKNPPNHSSDKIPNAPRQPPHTRKSQPITKIPQITVQTKSPFPLPTPEHAQITAHHKNPPNHSSDHPPSPHQPPHTRKSQPITKIPQITVQTKSPSPLPNPRIRANHSPSRKSPKSQFRQNPPNHSSDKIPNPPTNPRTRANHSPSRKSPKSQFRQNPMNSTGCESEGEGGPMKVCTLRSI